jgi:hypothetical protein
MERHLHLLLLPQRPPPHLAAPGPQKVATTTFNNFFDFEYFGSMENIPIKTPNPKCRLFLQIDQYRYLAAGVYLSEAPDLLPPPPRYTLYEYMYLIHTGGGGDELVRRLEGR